MNVVFARLRSAGLNANASKCSFGLKEIPYLGYLITWYWIKYDQKTVQGIMDLRRPTTRIESQALISKVQY